MSIDWITVAAQLANFLVLVWLLKRFLYRPILDGIDAREAEITSRMQVALHAKQEADAAEAEYQAQVAALKSEQAALLDAARREIEQERDGLLAEAHTRIERERTAWQTHLEQETQAFTIKLHRVAAHALLELTRKALIDLADDTLETRIAAHLARQIAAMDGDLKHAAGAPETATLRSNAAIDDTVQDAITAELRHRFPKIDVQFETDAGQAPGISLQLGGAHLAWTVDTYISGLESLIAEQLGTVPNARA